MSGEEPNYIRLNCEICGGRLRELHHIVNPVSWIEEDGTCTYKHVCETCFPKQYDNRR